MSSDAKRAYDRARYLSMRDEWLARSRARHSRVRDGIRSFVADYLATHPCVDCGEADPIVLDFDHMGEKEFGINRAVNLLVSIEKLTAEIAKCEVRCANCHRRKTHRTRGHRSKVSPPFGLQSTFAKEN